MATTLTIILNLTLSILLQPTTLTLALIPHRKNISTQTLTTTETRTLILTPPPTPNHGCFNEPSNWSLRTAQLKCNDNGRVYTTSLTFTHLDYESGFLVLYRLP